MITFANILRGGAVVARRAHNPKVRGSSPLPATRTKDDFFRSSFLFTITLTGFRTLLCCKPNFRVIIFLFLCYKSEEELSSAGEQLTSNKIYGFE